jgi:hypothetical protein
MRRLHIRLSHDGSVLDGASSDGTPSNDSRPEESSQVANA